MNGLRSRRAISSDKIHTILYSSPSCCFEQIPWFSVHSSGPTKYWQCGIVTRNFIKLLVIQLFGLVTPINEMFVCQAPFASCFFSQNPLVNRSVEKFYQRYSRVISDEKFVKLICGTGLFFFFFLKSYCRWKKNMMSWLFDSSTTHMVSSLLPDYIRRWKFVNLPQPRIADPRYFLCSPIEFTTVLGAFGGYNMWLG